MGTYSLSEAEIKVMNVVWDGGGTVTARQITQELFLRYGYSHNATYTLISRCIKKGALEREEPGYLCRALASRKEIQEEEANGLIDRLFSGSTRHLLASLVDGGKLTREDVGYLRGVISRMDAQCDEPSER